MPWRSLGKHFLRRLGHLMSDNKFILAIAAVGGTAGAALYSLHVDHGRIEWSAAIVFSVCGIMAGAIPLFMLAGKDVVSEELKEWEGWQSLIEGSIRPPKPLGLKACGAVCAAVLFCLGVSAAAIYWTPAIAEKSEPKQSARFSLRVTSAYYPHLFQIDQPVAFNIDFVNTGPEVHGTLMASRSYIEIDDSIESQIMAVRAFKDRLSTFSPSAGENTASLQNGFMTAFGQKLSPEDIDNLEHGRRVVIVIGVIKTGGPSGDIQPICQILQPPLPGGLVIFRDCDTRAKRELAS